MLNIQSVDSDKFGLAQRAFFVIFNFYKHCHHPVHVFSTARMVMPPLRLMLLPLLLKWRMGRQTGRTLLVVMISVISPTITLTRSSLSMSLCWLCSTHPVSVTICNVNVGNVFPTIHVLERNSHEGFYVKISVFLHYISEKGSSGTKFI